MEKDAEIRRNAIRSGGVNTRVGKHATADEFIEDLKAKSKKREVGSPTRAHTHAHTTRTRTHAHTHAGATIHCRH